MEPLTTNNEQPTTKVGVVGLGPVGMILSSHLLEAGFDVAICDNDKVKINLIRNEGIYLDGVMSKHHTFRHVCTSVSDLKEHDLDILIIASKSYHLPDVLKHAPDINTDKLVVVSAQNGIDVEKTIADEFGESKTCRMVINFAGNLNAPNNVKVTFFIPPNYLASLDDSQNETMKMLSEKLSSVGLITYPIHSFELLKKVWEKTILNSSLSALCGIGRMTIKEAMEMPDTVEMVEQVIREALEVAETEKIKFEDDFIRKCLRYLKKAGNHFPSLAVDLINGRNTEIDFFNGKIVEYGRKHYIETPLNLVLTNMVNVMTQKSILTSINGRGLRFREKLGLPSRPSGRDSGDCFLGIDLGSAYIKFAVIDANDNIVFNSTLRTLNRDRIAVKHVMETINAEFRIRNSCATGYGRKYFPEAEIIKTEVNCAAAGVSRFYSGAKNIIDIGGEDIKVIKCDEFNNVENFYLNDKCAAGTGSFITEIAERADLKIDEMSGLASKSHFNIELNSFCTVFAKTEVMKWLFDGVSVEDISRGVYLSLAGRVSRMRIDPSLPTYLVGGVIAYHPFLKDLLEEKLLNEVYVVENPQYAAAYGAALLSKREFLNKTKTRELAPLSSEN